MKVIRFRRQDKENWEIAFNERHLHEKLDGDTAEIINRGTFACGGKSSRSALQNAIFLN